MLACRGFRLSPHLFVLLAFATLIAAPLTAPGYFMFAHDARHTRLFVQMFDAALRDGALFPALGSGHGVGYGYPVWLILAPLPYYGAEFFHLLGLDFPSAIKAVEAVGWFASGLGMYLFATRVLGKNGGLVAAVTYLFVPYHIVDLYVRGAMRGISRVCLSAIDSVGGLSNLYDAPFFLRPAHRPRLWRNAVDARSNDRSLFARHRGLYPNSWIADGRPTKDDGHPSDHRTNLQSPVSLLPLQSPIFASVAILWGVALAAIFFSPS